MSGDLSNDQLRALSPFFVVDTNVLMFSDGKFTSTKLTMNLDQAAAFRANATEWEKVNSSLSGGGMRWTPIVDDVGMVLAYTWVENNTGVYHFWIRDINGEPIVHQIIGEKPLDDDPVGDMLFATIVTLGGALIVRSIAAGLSKVATAVVASGLRTISLAVARVAAGETTDGVVLTALRSVRAQALVKSLQARGIKAIVNIGGEAGSEEVAQFGADQIALNHQVRMSASTRFVPNLIEENGEKIGEIFEQNTIDKIVSRRLDAKFDPNKIAKGAYRVLKPGGNVAMHVHVGNPAFEGAFVKALQDAGFKDVTGRMGFFRAVK